MRICFAASLLSSFVLACSFDPAGGGGGPANDDAPPDEADAPATDAADDMAIDALDALDAPPPCPTEYSVSVGRGQSLYSLRKQPVDFFAAADDCADDLGGRSHLATFEMPTELGAVLDEVELGNDDAPWVGATCTAEDCADRALWFWFGNAPVSPTLWRDGDPNFGAFEKVAIATRMMGQWRLESFAPAGLANVRPYVCECR